MLEWLFEAKYFGNSLFQVALFFAVIVLTLVAGRIAYYLMKKHAVEQAKKSRTRADDLVMQVLEKPLIFFLIIAGISIGLRFLTVPAGMFSSVNAFFGVLLTIGATWIAVNIVDSAIKLYLLPLVEATDSKLDDQLIPIVSKSLKWLIVAFALMLIVSSFGYDITAILAGLGIGGLAIAFAAQATISEVFGGLNILISKPFIVGDWVDFEGIIGTVEKVSLRHTTIRNLDRRKVIIPNSKISGGVIVNISSEPARKVLMNLGLTYETPAKKMQKAIELVKEIINKRSGCEKEPIVQFSEFKDFSLNLLVIYFISDKDNWMQVKHEINMSIKEAFEKNKISFAYPTQLVYTKKG